MSAHESKEIHTSPPLGEDKEDIQGRRELVQDSGEPNTSPAKRGRGRPLGAKNKDTLFKEIMTGRFQESAQNNIEKVYKVLFEKAHGGDMKAIKLVLDRVVPVTKAVDLADMEKKGLTINISVGSMEESKKGNEIEIGEYTEIPEVVDED